MGQERSPTALLPLHGQGIAYFRKMSLHRQGIARFLVFLLAWTLGDPAPTTALVGARRLLAARRVAPLRDDDGNFFNEHCICADCYEFSQDCPNAQRVSIPSDGTFCSDCNRRDKPIAWPRHVARRYRAAARAAMDEEFAEQRGALLSLFAAVVAIVAFVTVLFELVMMILGVDS